MGLDNTLHHSGINLELKNGASLRAGKDLAESRMPALSLLFGFGWFLRLSFCIKIPPTRLLSGYNTDRKFNVVKPLQYLKTAQHE